MPNPPQKPTVGSGKKYGGISRTWWIVGGVATVGIVYYSVRKQKAAAAVDPNAIDTTGLATDGGFSGIPSGAGATGVTPSGVTPSDPFSNIPPGSLLTFTAPDGSTTTVQEPSATVPTGSTTSGGSSGGVDSSGGTTTTNTDTATTTVAPAPVIAPAPAKAINPALAWQNTAETWFAAHHYDAKTVRQALTRYQLGEGLDHTHLGIVETAIHHFGALVGTPAVKLLPATPRPRATPKHTGRQKTHH